ncbi:MULTISPECIES: DUF2378 family protein [Corallococcus]|uniref:DUF2378 family protein n=1 Tax=Corallococcus TaxID=83461 RepID=UPI0011803AD1|nr:MULTISPECIES: DUF2378 family protein [Corallococcus]NBD07444.1 DUF2378 family protein [Corallococcus silvisoli]TSC23013.1 DUF2378 family protein [Corallococcus sp. Z5C101001]
MVPSEKRIFAQSVDALFVRALGPHLTRDGRQRLKAVGLDLAAPLRHNYSLEQWRTFLDVAARDVFPGQPAEAAYLELGARYLKGFQQTSVGRASMQLVTHLGPEKTLERVPYNLRAGNNFNEVRVEELSKQAATLWVKDVLADTPFFACGFLVETLRASGAGSPEVTPLAFDGTAATYRLTWTEAKARRPTGTVAPVRRLYG